MHSSEIHPKSVLLPEMKRLPIYIGFFLLAWVLSCTRISDPEPSQIPFEKQTGPLPLLSLSVDSVHLSQTIRFDTIAQGGNFSIQFTKLNFGKIKIVEDGKAVQIVMDTGRWEKDSSQYTICKNSVCRSGLMKIKNRSYRPLVPIDTTDSTDTIPTGCITLATRTVYVPSFSSLIEIKRLFPKGVTGTILADSLRADRYTVSKTSDSTLSYIANPIPDDQLWAWDTIRYQATSTLGQCYRAKIAINLRDSCEAHARDDFFLIPSGTEIWPETELTANDKSCTNQLPDRQTRTPYPALSDWEYGNYKVMDTQFGVLIDTLIADKQHYKYRRTNPSATEDGFTYYFKNKATNRVTKAWVRIKF